MTTNSDWKPSEEMISIGAAAYLCSVSGWKLPFRKAIAAALIAARDLIIAEERERIAKHFEKLYTDDGYHFTGAEIAEAILQDKKPCP